MAAVPGVEPGVLPDGGVGGEAGVAPAVAFFDQVQLGAGVRSFAAHDDAHAFGVVGEHCPGEQAGQLGLRPRRARAGRRRRNPPQHAYGQRYDAGHNPAGQGAYHVRDHEVGGKDEGRRERNQPDDDLAVD